MTRLVGESGIFSFSFIFSLNSSALDHSAAAPPANASSEIYFQLNWFDQNGNLINDASYQSRRMPGSKLFEAFSIVTFTPTKEHHNATLKCTAWNEASDNLKPATVRLHVQYAPSVTVTPVKPGMVEEGHEVNPLIPIGFEQIGSVPITNA